MHIYVVLQYRDCGFQLYVPFTFFFVPIYYNTILSKNVLLEFHLYII